MFPLSLADVISQWSLQTSVSDFDGWIIKCREVPTHQTTIAMHNFKVVGNENENHALQVMSFL